MRDYIANNHMKIFSGRSLALACAALLFLGSALFFAQDFQLHTKIDLVVVPTTVRDQNGALVQNLTQDDFTILEDGRPQTIANFSTEPQSISAAIIIDTAMTGAELRRLRLVVRDGDGIKHFHESDEFATYRYDHLVTKLTDFTIDSQRLAESFAPVWDITDSKPADSEPGAVVGPAPLRGILDRTQIGTNGPPQDVTRPTTPVAPKPSTNSRPGEVSRVLYDAVFAAAMDLEKRPADHRKIILLISSGQVTGSNVHSSGETAARLFADGIQFYAIGTEPRIFQHFSLLNSYSRATGGATFEGGEERSMAIAFAQVVEQARDQYMLGYLSSNEVPGTRPVMRKIEVKVRDRKMRVTHRQSYQQYPN